MRDAEVVRERAGVDVLPRSIVDLATADTTLPGDVRPPLRRRSEAATLKDARTVVLTGATGFLGRWIAHALLTGSQAAVICLVRGRASEAEARLHHALATTGIDPDRYASRLDIVSADLAKPRLGMTAVAIEALADRADAVCHAGATVNWVQSYRSLRAANVGGTLELLRLAAGRGTPFHFVSSLSVCYSTTASATVDETYDPLPDLGGLHLGYAQTKVVAEALVREAGRRGLPVSIYRPSLISGHSESGAFNRDDILARVVSGCVRMRAAPDLDWSLDCLPVDVAADRIVATPTRPQAIHLAHRRPRGWRECVLWLRLYGYDVRLVPYCQWLRQLNDETGRTSERTHPLRPLRAFFLRRVSDGDARTMPELLTGSDRDFGVVDAIGPPLDAALLQRYCDAFVASGDLPAVNAAPAAADGPPLDAGYFTGVVGQPVLAAEPLGRLSEHSIISELTSWRSGRATGLFPFRLRLAGGDRDVVVKVKPRDRDAIAVGSALAHLCDRDVGRAYDRWSGRLGLAASERREAALYAQTDPRFVAHAPASLGSIVDPVSGTATLVLERLSNTLVRDSADRPDLWTPAHVECALRGLAALHAIWLGRTDAIAGESWIGHVPTSADAVDMQDLWTALAAHARPSLMAWTGDSIAAIHDRVIAEAGEWWQAMETGPRTLIHNDFTPRNICLRATPEGARLSAYDWELATIGAPQHDLAELLCFVLTERATRHEVDHWIERYRSQLEVETATRLDRREWIDGFRAALYDLMLNRLPMYCLIDRVRRQSFLPRVIRTWRRLYQFFPLGD
jgi:thioester reductase-like protein